jgi:eukaryotic-like serine/threonine-protein kinase
VLNVVGQGGKAARQALEAEDFEVAVEERESSFADEDEVIDQDPRGGTSVEAGSQVTIAVGTGPSTVEVPSVYGNTADQAAAVLEDAGLELGTVSEDYSGDVAAGQVFYQDPAEGERIEPGSAVNVTVSLGPEQVEVPEVFGLTLAEAQNAVADAGFYYNVVKVENEEPAGTALSTEPGAGTLLEPESTVTIYYSGGPPEPAPPEPAPPEPAPAAPNVRVPGANVLIPGGGGPQEPRGGDAGNRGKGNGDGGGGRNN